MAHRTSCSFNKNIKCDSMYELEEFYRQMKLAIEAESGEFKILAYGRTDMCPCDEKICPRYLAAQQQKQR